MNAPPEFRLRATDRRRRVLSCWAGGEFDRLREEPKARRAAEAARAGRRDRLAPNYDVWLDAKRGAVLVDGQVSLRRGMLEMFACIRNTKEHESVVTADTQALLGPRGTAAARCRAGPPGAVRAGVQAAGRHRDRRLGRMARPARERCKPPKAQDWVRDLKTGKAMTYPWVFAGSRFWTDEETGKQYYQAEGGDFICVSNFGTAALDIPVESSQSNDALEFEAFTERIPPLGTPVRLVLKPVLKEKAEGGRGKAEGKSARM